MAAADVEKRPDDIAYHVIEKAAAFQVEINVVIFPPYLTAIERTNCALPFLAGWGKAGEVMFADQHCRRGLHGWRIGRVIILVAERPYMDGNFVIIEYGIAIEFAAG